MKIVPNADRPGAGMLADSRATPAAVKTDIGAPCEGEACRAAAAQQGSSTATAQQQQRADASSVGAISTSSRALPRPVETVGRAAAGTVGAAPAVAAQDVGAEPAPAARPKKDRRQASRKSKARTAAPRAPQYVYDAYGNVYVMPPSEGRPSPRMEYGYRPLPPQRYSLDPYRPYYRW
jgi:hypothetical protein